MIRHVVIVTGPAPGSASHHDRLARRGFSAGIGYRRAAAGAQHTVEHFLKCKR